METADGVTVREAVPTDAFAVAALHLQAEREWGQEIPPRFLDTFADAWLRDRARRTFIAEDARGTPLGTVHGTVVHKLPEPAAPHRRLDARQLPLRHGAGPPARRR